MGKVNSSLKKLTELGYIDEKMQCTSKAYEELKEKKPQNAIILAAGFGMRMVPINVEVPKGILEINRIDRRTDQHCRLCPECAEYSLHDGYLCQEIQTVNSFGSCFHKYADWITFVNGSVSRCRIVLDDRVDE